MVEINKFLIVFLLLTNTCVASQVTVPYVYSTNDTVTNVKLNSNNNAITNIINGSLDNTNANTTSGYYFYRKVGALPSAGSQGATYFLTTDNSINFDTGSAFNKGVSLNSPSNGNLVYYNSGWNGLGVGSNGQVVASNGTIPTYQNISSIVSLLSQSNILAYGSSSSSSSTIAPSSLKMAYGSLVVAGNVTITNLSFSSSSSYSVTTSDSDGSGIDCVLDSYISGSSFKIDVSAGSHVCSWVAIGT